VINKECLQSFQVLDGLERELHVITGHDFPAGDRPCSS
jgi:hypothetical protein